MSLRRRSSKVWGAALAALFALTSLPLAGCGKEEAPAQKAPVVKTQQAGKASLSEESYSGTVKGRYETNLSFQVGGQILSRKVEEGSLVRAGETLMVIDARDAVQKANAGDAQVSQARAQLNLAQSNLARYTELYHQDVVPKATLDQYQTNYDAAFANWDGIWRMPTREDFEELLDACTQTWETLNGVYGRRLTSRNNGKSIFFPAAGRMNGVGSFDEGVRGYYWSSSLHPGDPALAGGFFFLSTTGGTYHYNRYLGLTVRPVK